MSFLSFHYLTMDIYYVSYNSLSFSFLLMTDHNNPDRDWEDRSLKRRSCSPSMFSSITIQIMITTVKLVSEYLMSGLNLYEEDWGLSWKTRETGRGRKIRYKGAQNTVTLKKSSWGTGPWWPSQSRCRSPWSSPRCPRQSGSSPSCASPGTKIVNTNPDQTAIENLHSTFLDNWTKYTIWLDGYLC